MRGLEQKCKLTFSWMPLMNTSRSFCFLKKVGNEWSKQHDIIVTYITKEVFATGSNHSSTQPGRVRVLSVYGLIMTLFVRA